MPGPIANNKCARGFPHKWVTIIETATHLIQVCIHCNGKQWKCRR